jgi:hypothetical protein
MPFYRFVIVGHGITDLKRQSGVLGLLARIGSQSI